MLKTEEKFDNKSEIKPERNYEIKPEISPFKLRVIYPRMRRILGMGRKWHKRAVYLKNLFKKRPLHSKVIPDIYSTCNTTTMDTDIDLFLLEGDMPELDGSLYICQCLGSPEAFMVGDTNIVKMSFNKEKVHLKNRLLWTPAAIAKMDLEDSKFRFDFLGLMYLSPGLGLYAYTEGMYLLPDGRIAVTSDIDRPWIINRESLKSETPLGRTEEWMPFMKDPDNQIMGSLFSAYSNSHVIHIDMENSEVYLVNLRLQQKDGTHPVKLIKWDGKGNFEHYLVLDGNGNEIEIKQSIHELVCTRDYVIFADAALATGKEMLFPWKNAPLPYEKTRVFIIARRDLADCDSVTAKIVEVDEPTIHLLAEYENPNDIITLYMLHGPHTNTAELIKRGDVDLDGKLYPEHLIGYGTLPVTDLSSVGKHKISVNIEDATVLKSEYLAEMPYIWGPYLYTYRNRQVDEYQGQDLFIMLKGFSRDLLPKRIYKAYGKASAKNKDRRISLKDIVAGKYQHNNSICRISTEEWKIKDAYIFPDKILLYTISHIQSKNKTGYILAGVTTDNPAGDSFFEYSLGHEYWIFREDDLKGGPICKLGHPDLDNATLFHSLYLPSNIEKELDKIDPNYKVDLKKDYPISEVNLWGNRLVNTFEHLVWPYYDNDQPELVMTKLNALAQKRVKNFGKEYVFGEKRIDQQTAAEYAERIVMEAERYWSTPGWKKVSDKNGILMESKAVSGDFESSKVVVLRTFGVIDAAAQDIFDLITSPEGFALLDATLDPEEHNRPPIETYEWREGSKLEVVESFTNLPIGPVYQNVNINGIDPKERIFVSKSVLCDKKPEGSIYSDFGKPETPRSIYIFAVKVESIDNNHSRVFMNYWGFFNGSWPWRIVNFANKRMLVKVYKDLKKKMAEVDK